MHTASSKNNRSSSQNWQKLTIFGQSHASHDRCDQCESKKTKTMRFIITIERHKEGHLTTSAPHSCTKKQWLEFLHFNLVFSYQFLVPERFLFLLNRQNCFLHLILVTQLKEVFFVKADSPFATTTTNPLLLLPMITQAKITGSVQDDSKVNTVKHLRCHQLIGKDVLGGSGISRAIHRVSYDPTASFPKFTAGEQSILTRAADIARGYRCVEPTPRHANKYRGKCQSPCGEHRRSSPRAPSLEYLSRSHHTAVGALAILPRRSSLQANQAMVAKTRWSWESALSQKGLSAGGDPFAA